MNKCSSRYHRVATKKNLEHRDKIRICKYCPRKICMACYEKHTCKNHWDSIISTLTYQNRCDIHGTFYAPSKHLLCAKCFPEDSIWKL